MSNDFNKVLAVGLGATAAMLMMRVQLMKKRRKVFERKIWVNPYLAERNVKGRFAVDFNDMVEYEKSFIENFHMNEDSFNQILMKLENHLLPKHYNRGDEMSPKLKLAAVLEYFASGSLQRHIASVYRISKQSFGHIIDQVCDAIIQEFSEEIPPFTTEILLQKANEYNYQWNFPNCVGSIDGKHVALRKPNEGGSIFYNYKQYHSIVLMAVADANYFFTYIDVGAYGSEGDASVFSSCSLGRQISMDNLPFPDATTLNNKKTPFFFVADDAFPLHEHIMKPYVPRRPNRLSDEERIFNYRLSRARRCVENAFGILCSKWQCLSRTLFCQPDRAQKIITACCYLHNHMLKLNKSIYCPSKYTDTYDEDTGLLIEGEWRKLIPQNSLFHENLKPCRGRLRDEPKILRDELKTYVNSAQGSVSWQNKQAFV